MKTKVFDSIQMKRDGAVRIHEEIKDFTFQEKVDYWERKSREYQEKVARLRRSRAESNSPGAV